MVILGKAARSNGGGILLGDDDRPFPNILGTTMNHRAGSSARPTPSHGLCINMPAAVERGHHNRIVACSAKFPVGFVGEFSPWQSNTALENNIAQFEYFVIGHI